MDEKTNKTGTDIDWIPAICLFLALATVAIVYFLHRDSEPLERLTIIVEYITVILVFFYGFIVLIRMATNKIDLSGLLCEPGQKKASISRFQLLIFTFVIAFSLLLIIVSAKEPQFPQIPSGILLLLGISASTYAVSKGINTSTSDGPNQNDQQPATNQTTVKMTDQDTGTVTTKVHDHSTGQSTTTVHEPTTGKTTTTVHNPTTVTTTTTVSPAPPPIVSAPDKPVPDKSAPGENDPKK